MKHAFMPSEDSKRELSLEEAFAIISCPVVHGHFPGRPHYHSRFIDAVSVVENALDRLQEVEHDD
jgi:hypothetical protein